VASAALFEYQQRAANVEVSRMNRLSSAALRERSSPSRRRIS
jgi:hypothetical protein